jgi:hypothetical protein
MFRESLSFFELQFQKLVRLKGSRVVVPLAQKVSYFEAPTVEVAIIDCKVTEEILDIVLDSDFCIAEDDVVWIIFHCNPLALCVLKGFLEPQ